MWHSAGALILFTVATLAGVVGSIEHPQSLQQLQEDFGEDHFTASDEQSSLPTTNLPANQFTSLQHRAFPDYRVRIKMSDFCDSNVNGQVSQDSSLRARRDGLH